MTTYMYILIHVLCTYFTCIHNLISIQIYKYIYIYGAGCARVSWEGWISEISHAGFEATVIRNYGLHQWFLRFCECMWLLVTNPKLRANLRNLRNLWFTQRSGFTPAPSIRPKGHAQTCVALRLGLALRQHYDNKRSNMDSAPCVFPISAPCVFPICA